MANRRMFSRDVIDTDLFLEMPASSQSLYFHLGMRADDDGFVSSPKKITKLVNCGADDLQVLISRGFVIPMDGGVIVIRHWKQNNYIRADRYTPTVYQKQFALLSVSNGAYDLDTNCLPDDNQQVDKWDAQVSTGQDREEKNNKTKAGGKDFCNQMISDCDLSDGIKESLRSWMQYKSERHEGYKSLGLKSLISQVTTKVNDYGEQAVCNLIEESMAAGWKGIAWSRLEKSRPAPREGEIKDGTTDGYKLWN